MKREYHTYNEPSEPVNIMISVRGAREAGRTQLIRRLTQNEFSLEHQPTKHVDQYSKTVIKNGKTYKLQFIDDWTSERARSLAASQHTRLKSVAPIQLFVYSISNQQTFDDALGDHDNDVEENSDVGSRKRILVGTKADLRHLRVIMPERASKEAKSRNIRHVQCSSLDTGGLEFLEDTIIAEYESMFQKNTSLDAIANAMARVKSEAKSAAKSELDSKIKNVCQHSGWNKYSFFKQPTPVKDVYKEVSNDKRTQDDDLRAAVERARKRKSHNFFTRITNKLFLWRHGITEEFCQTLAETDLTSKKSMQKTIEKLDRLERRLKK